MVYFLPLSIRYEEYLTIELRFLLVLHSLDERRVIGEREIGVFKWWRVCLGKRLRSKTHSPIIIYLYPGNTRFN
jgi:hypothetical protein